MVTARKQLRAWSVRLARVVAYGLVGSFATLLVVGIVALNKKPDLKPWHSANLDAEFSAKDPVASLEAYLELEDRLFAQLKTKVCDRIAPQDANPLNRFHRGSLSDPERWERNWNRSYELPADDPASQPARAGVLLVHGLSDSPYSLRTIGERLHRAGAHVLALRLPGHGTAPAALARTRWQDMAAAVELAMRHLRAELGDDCPLSMVGYSNGAALTVRYVLSTLEDPESLPRVDRIVLISPQIAVTKAAGLAIWQARIGRVLGLRKLAWQNVSPEYDPFKYGSFPINAGVIAHQLTGINRSSISRLQASGKLENFPPVLTFQSVVDATVSSSAVVEELFARLPPHSRQQEDRPLHHELVAFDVNRTVESQPLIRVAPMSRAREILEDPSRSFAFTLLTNETPTSLAVAEKQWPPEQTVASESAIGISWPREVYSLSHVALPFSAHDPLYGTRKAGKNLPGIIHLGDIILRGERGTLLIPPADILRQRWNPFYSYLENRAVNWLGLGH